MVTGRDDDLHMGRKVLHHCTECIILFVDIFDHELAFLARVDAYTIDKVSCNEEI